MFDVVTHSNIIDAIKDVEVTALNDRPFSVLINNGWSMSGYPSYIERM